MVVKLKKLKNAHQRCLIIKEYIMGISPPNFKKDAIPTPQGWRDPNTNELLVARKISLGEINEYFGFTPPVKKPSNEPKVTAYSHVQSRTQEDVATLSDNAHEDDANWHSGCASNKSHEDMTKDELEAKGREHGIELDKRKSHEDLVEELEAHLGHPKLENMSKTELEELGREHGIELDRRRSKKVLIEELKKVL